MQFPINKIRLIDIHNNQNLQTQKTIAVITSIWWWFVWINFNHRINGKSTTSNCHRHSVIHQTFKQNVLRPTKINICRIGINIKIHSKAQNNNYSLLIHGWQVPWAAENSTDFPLNWLQHKSIDETEIPLSDKHLISWWHVIPSKEKLRIKIYKWNYTYWVENQRLKL